MPYLAKDFLESDNPWSPEDFAEPEESRAAKGERLKAEMAEARKVPLSDRLLNTVGYLSDYVVDPISKMNPLTILPRITHDASKVIGTIPQDEPFPLDEDRPLVDLHQALVNPVVEAGSLVDELRYGTQQAAADVGQFFVTPRGISTFAAGAAPAAARAALASGFAGSMTAAVPEAYEATKEAFRGGSVSDKTRATLNFLVTAGAPLAIAAGALKQGLKPAERLVPEIERTADARQISQAAEVHGPLREVPAEVPQEVPAQVGGERVSTPKEQAVQGEVALASDTVPDYDPGNLGKREVIKQKQDSGLTMEEAVAEAAKDTQATEDWVNKNTQPGDIIENKEGWLYRKDNDGTWRKLEDGIERVGIITTTANLRGGKIIKRNTKLTGSGKLIEDAVVLAPETPARPKLNVLPAARELAKQYEGKVGELEKLAVDADAAASKAASDLQVFVSTLPENKATWTGPQRMEYLELAERVTPTILSKQLHNEALQVLRSEVAPAPAATGTGVELTPSPKLTGPTAASVVTPAEAPAQAKTAVFNGIQMAGPSFRYFNEKTGRWNDVSAETAKQRGVTIPPEELAKAEAAGKARAAEGFSPKTSLETTKGRYETALQLKNGRTISQAELFDPNEIVNAGDYLDAITHDRIEKRAIDKKLVTPKELIQSKRGFVNKESGKFLTLMEVTRENMPQKGSSETKTEGAVEAQPGTGETGQAGQETGVGVRGSSDALRRELEIPGRQEAGPAKEPGLATEAPVRRSDGQEVVPSKEIAAEPALGAQLAAGIPDPVATAKAAGELIKEGVTMARRIEFIEQAIGKPKEAAPPIKTDVDTPLPDFNEHGASKKIFSQTFGFERLPFIGALFGGTRRLVGHVNESLTTYWAERQIGKSISSAFGNEYSWLNKPFEIKDGQITNITPVKEGASRYISDVFESLQKDPNSYKLNAEQQKAFDAIQKLEKDFSRLEDRYKIGKSTDNEAGDVAELFEDADVPKQKGPYFSRIVTSRPGGVETGLTRGSGVGSKAFFEKSRLFETEAEGWARGYQYEPSIVNRLATRADRLYKRIADKRLADDSSLGGISRKEVEAQLKSSFAEELASGEMTEKKITQMADSIEARGRVYEPAFFNKIFPEETAAQLNKAFPKSQSSLRQVAASLNNAIKGLQLGLDLGVGFIQGQALLARHPGIWGKAQFNSLAAMFHKEQFPNYVRNNLEPIRELAQLGSGVGRLEEYMAGLGEKELLSRIPGVQAVTTPFARQFQTFLDVAKVEMWKAYRETTPREQWSDVVQTLESVLSSGRMEGVGVSPNRALTERALLLAPAYYRGGLNMVAAMGEKGVSGQVARRAMVAYATAGGVLFYGLGKMLGMSDDELKQRMNPARSDFMMWRVKTKDRISNVGFGGFYRSLLRLMGNTAKTSMDNPESWKSLAPNKNPITKWYRGHAGPVVTGLWDGLSGKDYMGEDTDIVSILGRSVTPITVQSARGKPGQPTPVAAEAGGSFIGLQSFPATSKTELNKLHGEWLSSNKDPKVKADYERNKGKPREQSQYAALSTALIDKDEKAVAQSIKDLQADSVKRSDIFKRMNPYTADGSMQKPLFHESAALEGKFRKSLTPEQMKLYEEARKDRKEQWQLFLKAWRDSK